MEQIVIHKDDIAMEGFMVKQSKHLKEWRQRWFVLTSQYLCSFKAEGDYTNPTEYVRLAECSTVRSAEDSTGKENSFCVQTAQRFFLLDCTKRGREGTMDQPDWPADGSKGCAHWWGLWVNCPEEVPSRFSKGKGHPMVPSSQVQYLWHFCGLTQFLTRLRVGHRWSSFSVWKLRCQGAAELSYFADTSFQRSSLGWREQKHAQN